MSGHKCVWAQTCVGAKVFGNKRVWAQTCLGTNVSGHKRVLAQSCGHSRVGTIMYGHKRGGTPSLMTKYEIQDTLKVNFWEGRDFIITM